MAMERILENKINLPADLILKYKIFQLRLINIIVEMIQFDNL